MACGPILQFARGFLLRTRWTFPVSRSARHLLAYRRVPAQSGQSAPRLQFAIRRTRTPSFERWSPAREAALKPRDLPTPKNHRSRASLKHAEGPRGGVASAKEDLPWLELAGPPDGKWFPSLS